MINPGVAIERRDGAQRNGNQHRDDARHERDLERDRHAQRDLLHDRLARPQGFAEVEARQSRHVIDELDVERLVQSKPLALRLDRLLGDSSPVRPQLHHHDVARHDADEEEDGNRNTDQRRDHED